MVGPALTNLFRNKVSEQDIIEINQVVQEYKNIIVALDDYSEGKDTKHDKGIKPNDNWFCRSLIDDMKRFGGIRLAIKEQSEKLERVKQEVLESEKKNQEVPAYCHLAIALACIINHKIAHLKGLMDHYLKECTQNQTRMSIQSPILIFVIYDKSNSKEKGEGEGEGEGEQKQN